MKTPRKNSSAAFWFLLPMVSCLVIFQLYPIVLNLIYSLLNWNGISSTANFIGLANYISLFQDAQFWNALKNSLLYSITATALQMGISFGLAYLVEYGPIQQKGFFRVIFILPIVASSAAVGMIFKTLFSYDGMVNAGLNLFGVPSVSWLSSPFWAFVLILIVSVWKETGTLFIYWMAGFKTVSTDVIEAAKVDGLSSSGMLRRIFLPLMKPVIVLVGFITFVNSLKAFDLIQKLTGGGPYFATDMLSTFIYQTAFNSTMAAPRMSYAASAAIVVVLVPMVLYGLFKLVRSSLERSRS